jgi:hypothetical protein
LAEPRHDDSEGLGEGVDVDGSDGDGRANEPVRAAPAGRKPSLPPPRPRVVATLPAESVSSDRRRSQAPGPTALPTVGERSGTAGLFQDLTFLQVWPIEGSDEYSDGQLTRHRHQGMDSIVL